MILANAREAKNVPGRKTDINYAQWLQRLHAYGLLRGIVRLKSLPVYERYYANGNGYWNTVPLIFSICRKH